MFPISKLSHKLHPKQVFRFHLYLKNQDLMHQKPLIQEIKFQNPIILVEKFLVIRNLLKSKIHLTC